MDLCTVRVAAGRAADVGIAGTHLDTPASCPPLVADGIRRVCRAPAILCAVWAVTALVALRPAADLPHHRCRSGFEHGRVERSVNWTWWRSSPHASLRMPRPFSTSSGASVLTNVGEFVSGALPGPLLAPTRAAYMLAWIFLMGGILDRLSAGSVRMGSSRRAACSVPVSAPGGNRRHRVGIRLRRARLAVRALLQLGDTGGHGGTPRSPCAALTVFFVLVVGAVMKSSTTPRSAPSWRTAAA